MAGQPRQHPAEARRAGRIGRSRMIDRGFIVMHWKYGFDGWFDNFGQGYDNGGGGGVVAT